MSIDTTDRKAAMLARRAGWTAPVEITTTIAQLKVGDHVLVIPSQHGVRGSRVNANITAISPCDTVWFERAYRGSRVKYPVDSLRIKFASIEAAVNVPLDFTVTIQRVPA